MIRLFATIVTLCIVAVLAAPFAVRLIGPGDRAERLLRDGEARAEQGDWVQARVRFDEILSTDPENLDARLGLARALRDGGAYETAATHLLYIIDKAPDDVEARVEFGEMLFMAGQMEESRAQLDRIATLGGASPRIDALIAAHAAVEGEDARARTLAEGALDRAPDLSQAYATLVALELRAGDLAAALGVLDRARVEGAETLSLGLLRLSIYQRTGRADEIGAELAALGTRHGAMPELKLATARWILGHEPANADAATEILKGLVAESVDDPARTIRLTGSLIDLLGIEGAREVFAEAEAAHGAAFGPQIAALDMAGGDRAAAIARLEQEIVDGARAETRDAARLLLARLLDPVDDIERRAELAETVLASDRANPSAHILLADADLRKGDPEAAIAHLRNALSARPEDIDVILELARAHALAGSEELAQDHLSKAAWTSGQAPDIMLRYARLVAARQGPYAAAGLIDASLELHPDHAGLLVRRAQIALSTGDIRTAREMRGRLDGSSVDAEVLVALDRALRAQAEGADSVIAELETDWNGSGGEAALMTVVTAYLRDGRGADARALLDTALAERPDWKAARLKRADVHMADGAFAEAEADLAHAAAADPGDAALQANLARLRVSLGRGAEADAAIATGLAAAPEDYELQVLRAWRLETAGRTEEALAAFERLALREPGDPRVAARLGLLLSEAGQGPGDLDRAVRVTALLDPSTDADLREIRGWVLHLAGESMRAVDILAPLAALRPDDLVLRARLGLSMVGAEQADQGRIILEEALRLAVAEDLAVGAVFDRVRRTLSNLADPGESMRLK